VVLGRGDVIIQRQISLSDAVWKESTSLQAQDKPAEDTDPPSTRGPNIPLTSYVPPAVRTKPFLSTRQQGTVWPVLFADDARGVPRQRFRRSCLARLGMNLCPLVADRGRLVNGGGMR